MVSADAISLEVLSRALAKARRLAIAETLPSEFSRFIDHLKPRIGRSTDNRLEHILDISLSVNKLAFAGVPAAWSRMHVGEPRFQPFALAFKKALKASSVFLLA